MTVSKAVNKERIAAEYPIIVNIVDPKIKRRLSGEFHLSLFNFTHIKAK